MVASAVVAQGAAHAWASAAVGVVADADVVVDAADGDRGVELAVAQIAACSETGMVLALAMEQEPHPGDIQLAFQESRRHLS